MISSQQQDRKEQILKYIQKFQIDPKDNITQNEKIKKNQNLKKWLDDMSNFVKENFLNIIGFNDKKVNLLEKKDFPFIFKEDTINIKNKEIMKELILEVESRLNPIQLKGKKSQPSFNLVNLREIVKQLILFRTLLPRVKPFYAVKCNNDPTFVRLLTFLNCGFDCASLNEIDLATNTLIQVNNEIQQTSKGGKLPVISLENNSKQKEEEGENMKEKIENFLSSPESEDTLSSLSYQEEDSNHELFLSEILNLKKRNEEGLPGKSEESSKILFANPCKLDSHIEYALDKDVQYVTADNEIELEKIARIEKEKCKKMKIILRISTDDSSARWAFSGKFGCPMNEIDELLEKCSDLNLDFVGCSFHVGSGNSSPTSYEKALLDVKKVFEMSKKYEKNNWNPKIVDIGGGFWGDEIEKFADIANYLRNYIDEIFPNKERYIIVAEPGRFFATKCVTLVTEIYAKRRVNHSENNSDIDGWIYLNDSIYHSFNNINFDHYIFEPNVLNLKKEKKTVEKKMKYHYKIFGFTCDSIDTLSKDCEFNEELFLGDQLFFENMGSYTSSCATNFNGFQPPTSHYLWI